ncbi:MAG TPA: glycosyltransferase family 4 protein [Stellaceae bacterium]|nr:glycosyltransferase family 4 protein [Stellaceae bacterium]
MRVLLVHNFYQIPGGESSVVREELAMLARNGVDVELFSVSNNDIRGRVAALSTALWAVYNPRSRDALAKKLRTFLPDVVHIHNFFPLLSPSILDACAAAGVASVITLHNFRIFSPGALLHPAEAFRGRPLGSACWWTVPKRVYRNSAAATLAVAAMIEFHKLAGTWARKVDRFIALTDWAQQMFIEGGLPAERVVVKPNCIARPPAFANRPRDAGLFVGRLDEQKGIRPLLQAWKEIDYPLRIIGDGPLSEFVAQNSSPRITYLGRQPRDVVHQEMQAARFLVLPSLGHEMFPVTILEAFSNRLPVICSDLPSLEALVEPGISGVKFLPGDADGLADRVRWAISNMAVLDEMGRRACEIYEERYTPEVNFNQLIGIYSEAIASRAIRRDHDIEPGRRGRDVARPQAPHDAGGIQHEVRSRSAIGPP